MPWKPKYHKNKLPRSSSSRERQRFYQSAKWRRLRVVVLKRDVECQLCHERAATIVDHSDNNHMNNDLSNLRGLCASCHGRKTLCDIRGPQTEPAEKPVRQLPEDYKFV